MEFWGKQGGKTGGGKRGTLIWLMVLNNNYKERAGKVQHSSADTSVSYCKPQTPINTGCIGTKYLSPSSPESRLDQSPGHHCTAIQAPKAGPNQLNSTEVFQGHWGEEAATVHSWFILEAWAFEQVHEITAVF